MLFHTDIILVIIQYLPLESVLDMRVTTSLYNKLLANHTVIKQVAQERSISKTFTPSDYHVKLSELLHLGRNWEKISRDLRHIFNIRSVSKHDGLRYIFLTVDISSYNGKYLKIRDRKF